MVGVFTMNGWSLQLHSPFAASEAGGEDQTAVGIEVDTAAVGQVDGITAAFRHVDGEHILNLHILDGGGVFLLFLGNGLCHLAGALAGDGDGRQFGVGLINHQGLFVVDDLFFLQEDKADEYGGGSGCDAPPDAHLVLAARLVALLKSLVFLVDIDGGSLLLRHHLHRVKVAAVLQQLLVGVQLGQLFVGNISSILDDVERSLHLFIYLVKILHMFSFLVSFY